MKTKNYYAYPAHKTGCTREQHALLRYRFVIYALKGIAGLKAVDSLECSTLLETIRKGKHAVETKGESLVMWVQKYEPGTEPSGWLTVTVFTRKDGPRSHWMEKPDYTPY